MKINKLFSQEFIVLLGIIIIPCQSICAQEWVMKEISDEATDSPLSGIWGLFLLIGIIWLLSNTFKEKEKKEEIKNSIYNDSQIEEDIYYEDEMNDKTNYPFIDDVKEKTTSSNQYIFTGEEQPKQNLTNENFKNQCIRIYGEYAEVSIECIFIKEDGEYRIIKKSDERYNILSAYVYENYPDRCRTTRSIGSEDMLRLYWSNFANSDRLPLAKSIEKHGVLEKEYLGEKILQMKLYYIEHFQSFLSSPFITVSLRDYCFALGWETAVYIHKYLKQPMDEMIYREFRDMQLRGMTVEEYKKYREKSGLITKSGDEYFDGWNNYIGKTYQEASENLKKKEVISMAQAINEVKKIDWHL